MATNYPINPWGSTSELPAGYPIVNDLVTGGANKALSAQMGKELNSKYLAMGLSKYDTIASYINTESPWKWLHNFQSYTCKLIPVVAGETYKITAGANGSRMAVLAADDSTTNAEFATGYSAPVTINANEELEFTVPDDGLYLYVAVYSTKDLLPASVAQKKVLWDYIEEVKECSAHTSQVPSMLKVGEPTNIIYTIDDFLMAHEGYDANNDGTLKFSLDLGKTWKSLANTYGNITNAFMFADGTLMFCTRESDGCHAYWIRDFVNMTVNETTIIDYDGNELALNANETRLYNVGRVTHHEYVNGVEHFCFGDYTITTDNPRLWYSCDNGHTIRCAFAFGYSQVNGQTIYARHIHWFCYNQYDGYFYALTGDHMRNGVSECHIMRGRHDANHVWTWEVLKTGQAYKLVAPAFDAGNMYCVTDYTDSEFANKKGIVSLPINSLDVADMKYLFRATAEFMAEGSYDSRAAAIASYFTDNHGWRIAGSDYLGNSKLLIAKGGHNFKWVDNDAGIKMGNWMGPNNAGDCYATYTIPDPSATSNEAWLRISHRKSYNVTEMFRNSGMTDFCEGWRGTSYPATDEGNCSNIYLPEPTHWNGKKWWGFGTSITDTSGNNPTGKYAPFLVALSGMTYVNHGHAGKGITKSAAGQDVYDDIMAITSACDADLITLEVGANDDGAPLGSVYDGLPDETVLNGRNHDDVVNYTGVTDNSTLCGALNLCLRHLLATTNAQIVVIASPHQRKLTYTSGQSAGQTKYYDGNEKSTAGYTALEMEKAIEDICKLHSVYFVSSANGLGFARLNGSDGDDYVVDNIHQTQLGGYNYAQAIWARLKDIPLFYTQIPS